MVPSNKIVINHSRTYQVSKENIGSVQTERILLLYFKDLTIPVSLSQTRVHQFNLSLSTIIEDVQQFTGHCLIPLGLWINLSYIYLSQYA